MSPLTPQVLIDLVVEAYGELKPDAVIERTGVMGLFVDGSYLPLENLWRMVQMKPTEATALVFRYLEAILSSEQTVNGDVAAWCEVKPRIMPRIQPITIFGQLARELITARPFVNDTVVTFVCDSPHSTVSLRREQIDEWGITIEEIDEIASTNLARHNRIEIEVRRDSSGGKTVMIGGSDGYNSSRILHREFRERIAWELGSTFYVGIPSRDTFIAFSAGSDEFVEAMKIRLRLAYARLPYPICPHPFLATPDGIAGTLDAETSEEVW